MRYRDPINYKQFKFYVPPYTPTSTRNIYGYTRPSGIIDASVNAGDVTSENPDNSGIDDETNRRGGRISGIILDI
jgi:hypothetical protein